VRSFYAARVVVIGSAISSQVISFVGVGGWCSISVWARRCGCRCRSRAAVVFRATAVVSVNVGEDGSCLVSEKTVRRYNWIHTTHIQSSDVIALTMCYCNLGVPHITPSTVDAVVVTRATASILFSVWEDCLVDTTASCPLPHVYSSQCWLHSMDHVLLQFGRHTH